MQCNVVLKCGCQLGRRRHNRYILIVRSRRRPVALAQGDIDNEPLCCRRWFQDHPHECEDILCHTRTVADHTATDGFGKDGCDTKKSIVCIEKISNDCDNTVRDCICH